MLTPRYLQSTATYKAASDLARSPEIAKMIVSKMESTIEEGVQMYRAEKAKKDLQSQEKSIEEINRALNEVAKTQQTTQRKSAASGPDFGRPHLPLVDLDGDGFSPSAVYRGSHWRGRDCNDWSSKVYPGRKSSSNGDVSDYSCNGISGKHPTSGAPWKEAACANSRQRGVAVVGDSAGAHFGIPVQWVTPAAISVSSFSNFFSVLSDEFDFPQNSAYTAYLDANPDMPLYPLKSIYKDVVRRNKCNFRDFQNVAVNGGDSYNVQTYVKSLSRNNATDHPMVVFLELLGNDVCGSAHSLNDATPPATFKQNIYNVLGQLDAKLPAGSHVVILGLADGRVLYDVLHAQPHPIGGGVTYTDLYNFLNCVYANPCWGWLNSNTSIRDATTAHAMTLNQQYRAIISETNHGRSKYKNFDLIYYDLPADEILDGWAAAGHKKSQLVDPVDGFHPNQYFLSILSDWLVAHLDADNPDILGPTNPQNSAISSTFGNQGGY